MTAGPALDLPDSPSPSPSSDRSPAPGPAAHLLHVTPWEDALIDQLGHDPRSNYVERFWLGVLGPSAVWLLRHLAMRLDEHPEGCTIDVDDTARALGIGNRGGRNAQFTRTVERVCGFGLAQHVGGGLAVRRHLPPLNLRQVQRLPTTLQDEHRSWQQQAPAHPPVDQLKRRARALALSLLQLGETPDDTERQLHRWRFHPAMAFDAVRWALEVQAAERAEADRAAGDRPTDRSAPTPSSADRRQPTSTPTPSTTKPSASAASASR